MIGLAIRFNTTERDSLSGVKIRRWVEDALIHRDELPDF